MPEETTPIQQLFQSIGVVAEMSSILRDRLIENGFTREEAVFICSDYITNVFTNQT